MQSTWLSLTGSYNMYYSDQPFLRTEVTGTVIGTKVNCRLPGQLYRYTEVYWCKERQFSAIVQLPQTTTNGETVQDEITYGGGWGQEAGRAGGEEIGKGREREDV